jgi:hypothetical protein
MRHIVVALMAARIGCAHAAPTGFPDEPPGVAASLNDSIPAILSLKRSEGSPNPIARLVAQQDMGNEQHKAEELYKATSRDAETFEAALLIPEIRLKLERALHQKLSDQMLHRLAGQAKLEAIFWYKYMQGLEQRRAIASPIQ